MALVPEPLYIHCDGRIVYANHAGARMLKAGSPEELIGRDALALFHPGSHASVLERRELIARTGRPAPFKEHKCLRDDGSAIAVETGPAPIIWKGRPATLIAAREISDRRRIEGELRLSEQRHRDLINLLPDAVLVNKGDQIVFVNPACVELYRANSADEIVGRSPFELIHPDFHDAVRERHKINSELGTPLPYLDVVNLRLDGSPFPVESHSARISWEGSEARLAVIRDISTRKQLEEDLAQARKMEAIGHLTGGMAHEFNNLLQAMLGYLEVLKTRTMPGVPERENVAGLIEGAVRACLKGAEITQSLLAFARKQPLRATPIDVAEIVEGATSILRSALSESVDLAIVMDAGLWHAVADSAQVQTCLINIVINARDAMSSGGIIRISGANVKIDAESVGRLGEEAREGEFVCLAVSDNGPGMPQSVLDRVFEPFFTTKEVGDGTGLGLSMVYGFAKQSGGFVAIDSAPGAGTRVALYLPRAGAGTGRRRPGEDYAQVRQETA